MQIRRMILEVKLPLMIFLFVCQCYRTQVLANRFSRMPFFHHFYPKINSNAHFNSVFSNNSLTAGYFNGKMMNAVRFSFIKIPMNFMLLRSKLASEIYQKIEILDGKT